MHYVALETRCLLGDCLHSVISGRKGNPRAKIVGNVGLRYALVRLDYEKADVSGLSVPGPSAQCMCRVRLDYVLGFRVL